MNDYVTAKEIADVLHCSDRHLRRPSTQRLLGLDRCLDRTFRKPLRFDRQKTTAALRDLGKKVPW